MPGVRGRASAEANAIAIDVIRSVGAKAPRFRIAAEIERRCRAGGIEPPSAASIRARIAREVSLAEPLASEDVRLVVDRVRLGPTRLGDGTVERPFLTLAMLDPTRIVVGHSVDVAATDGPGVVATMLERLDREHQVAPPIILRLPALGSGGWPELRAALEAAGVEVATPVERSMRLGREIDLLIGRRLGALRLGERGSRASGASSAPPDLSTLRSLIAAAVTVHNDVRTGGRQPFSITGFRGFNDGWRR